jgi:hypothetical protein
VEVDIIDDLSNVVAMDTTGRYPKTSSRGHKYIFVMYDRDTSYIYLYPMKSRKSHALVEAYEHCYNCLVKQGFAAKLLKLDNEISKELVAAIEQDNLKYQTVPPGDHRQNPAERSIQDVKAHFISVRACVDPAFPKNCWDLLLPHVELTMSLLRPSKINPLLSAYTMVYGHFDYRKHPLAPAGSKVIVHDKPKDRGTWADRGTGGFFIAHAPQHYRCFSCYMPRTNSIRTSKLLSSSLPVVISPP